MNTYEKSGEGGPVIVNQISAEEICPACPDFVGALIPILCPDFQLSTVNFQPSHLLGLRRRVRGRLSRPFRLGDRGECLHVEFLVVPISRHHPAFQPLPHHTPPPQLPFQYCRQPTPLLSLLSWQRRACFPLCFSSSSRFPFSVPRRSAVCRLFSPVW